MTRTATARAIGDGLMHEVEVDERHEVVPDEPEPAGGDGASLGATPHELLAATLAAGVATTIAAYAEDRGWPLGEASVDVTWDTDRTVPRLVVETHLPDGLPLEQRTRLELIAQTCPVRRALEGGFAFDGRLAA